MGFSEEVTTQALVACRRTCCICHVVSGVEIECHHIIPQAEGGKDDADNCIPLCFGCHSKVGHYNPKQPKGTKFKPKELKLHRDQWYQKVASGFNAHPMPELQRPPLCSNLSELIEHLDKDLRTHLLNGEDAGASVLEARQEACKHLPLLPDCDTWKDANLEAVQRLIKWEELETPGKGLGGVSEGTVQSRAELKEKLCRLGLDRRLAEKVQEVGFFRTDTAPIDGVRGAVLLYANPVGQDSPLFRACKTAVEWLSGALCGGVLGAHSPKSSD